MSGVLEKTTRDDEQKLVISVDLDKAQGLIGKEILKLDIPVESVGGYLQGLSHYDGYDGLRNFYRNSIRKNGQLFAMYESDLKSHLDSDPSRSGDLFDYLVTDREERPKHSGWEWLNEAVLVEGWVFPAYALEKASVPSDFNFQEVNVELKRGDTVVGQLLYEISSDKMIKYKELK